MLYKRPFLWVLLLCLSLGLISSQTLLAHDSDDLQDQTISEQLLETDDQDDDDGKNKGLTPYFFYAIAKSDIVKVRAYIEQKVDVNRPFGRRKDTPLIFAIRTLAVLVNNIKKGVFNDIHTGSFAYKKQMDVIQLILFHEDIHLQRDNKYGQTAISLASQEGLHDVLKIVLKKIQLQSMHQQLSIQHAVMMASSEKLKADPEKYREQLAQLKISEELKAKISQALDKAAGSTTEAGKMQEYIKLIFQLPWDKRTEDPTSLSQLEQILDLKQYGMKEAKDKIKEYLAPRILMAGKKDRIKAPILCLVGAPGVGKTSLVKIIAEGLNRNFIRISLGGVHDESSIRGFNKAYVGSEAGRIIKGLRNNTKNPVILLDEIDKMGLNSANGSPASALLEALDPEQNEEFFDHFLDIPFDLSEALFIATANNLENIPYALWDRLTIVEVSNYTNEEKFEIAKQFLVPRTIKESGLGETDLTFSDDVIKFVIQHYTYEAGVRSLERKLKTICSKVACTYLKDRTIPTITIENLKDYLGAEYNLDTEKVFIQENQVGVSTGLAANILGGSIIIMETAIYSGSGALQTSGQLGQVAQESMHVVQSYVKAHAQELGIDQEFLDKHDIHIHSPAGPKEGPSAGIAILSAVVSRLTGRRFDKAYAMTGELSLTGRVLPIGGLREKLSAAKRVGIFKVIIPQANAVDLVDLQDIIQGMEIIPVSYAHEVLDRVLLPKGVTT